VPVDTVLAPKPLYPLSGAIVIDPEPLVIVVPAPAVSVALVNVLPVVLPIRSCPLVYVVWPVPPEATGKVPVVNSDVDVAYIAPLAVNE